MQRGVTPLVLSSISDGFPSTHLDDVGEGHSYYGCPSSGRTGGQDKHLVVEHWEFKRSHFAGYTGNRCRC